MRKLSVIFVLLLGLVLSSTPAEASGGSQLIIINKRTNTLAFYDGGHLVKTFKVATGRTRDLTPEGKFRIVNKIINRPYYKEHIAGGDPRNPLGNRWMGLEARGTYGTTYGIHGNNNENSIGKYVSHGCVRMHNEEVRWLFNQVQMFTTVVITYSNSSFDAIAQANGYGVSIPASGGIENDNSTPQNGWVVTNGKTYYYANGIAKTGWQTINGKWYFFDTKGVLKTGWLSLGGETYYLDGKGVRQTGWVEESGKWYFFDNNGVMKTGMLTDGGKTYYLDEKGVRQTGWVEESGKRYYFDQTGAMKTGWFEENGKRYYLDPKTGTMKTGWLESSEKSYYLDHDGVLRSGWVEVEGKWYYLNQSGTMTTGWINFNGKWYYQDANGVKNTVPTPVMSQIKFYENMEPLRNGWIAFSGNRYYFGNLGGSLTSGWLRYEGSWYYLKISPDMAGIQ